MQWVPALVALLAIACSSSEGSPTRPPTKALGAECNPKLRECGANAFCNETYDWCGPHPLAQSGSGVCTSASEVWCHMDLPACGCDGKVYPTECAAFGAGTDVGDVCTDDLTPTGRFRCGAFYCDAKVSYCHYSQGDAYDFSSDCESLPVACGTAPSCACLPTSGLISCKTVEGNGVTGLMLVEELI